MSVFAACCVLCAESCECFHFFITVKYVYICNVHIVCMWVTQLMLSCLPLFSKDIWPTESLCLSHWLHVVIHPCHLLLWHISLYHWCSFFSPCVCLSPAPLSCHSIVHLSDFICLHVPYILLYSSVLLNNQLSFYLYIYYHLPSFSGQVCPLVVRN